MKTRELRTWITATFVMAALLILPLISVAEKAEKEDLKPKVTVRVDGLTCPFCAYGLEKRIKKLSAVQESTINIKEGTVALFPKEGRHIELDDVKEAVEKGGFTAREIQVALVGKLMELNGETLLRIVSTDKEGQKDEAKYLLKKNDQLKQLLASVKAPDGEVFIAGKAVKETPHQHHDHPYTITIEKSVVLSKEKG
ncbi:heavy-metal-associated domain-containing protein [Candidatus Poribacteria bacterium]|nr:heavy-metal-associated domain-containing protein [Candidatus Poribacteria bacterium]